MRNKIVDITTNTADGKRIIRENYEQLYAYKFYNHDKIEKFLKIHKQLKFTQDEMNNLNSPVIIQKTEFRVKKISKNKSPSPGDFTD